jgi:hypothetical protein
VSLAEHLRSLPAVELAALLRRRPDVLVEPAPRDLADVVDRLTGIHSLSPPPRLRPCHRPVARRPASGQTGPGKRLLFDEIAPRSGAKEADARAVDAAWHRPEVLDDESVPLPRRALLAERHRLGLE